MWRKDMVTSRKMVFFLVLSSVLPSVTKNLRSKLTSIVVDIVMLVDYLDDNTIP
jgi:hypothetical protein